MRHPYFDLPRPIVVGHRGASGERPENTLESFERAVEQGAAILETDVHRSADGEVVISHDDDLARMTDAQGPLAERSWAELRRLDAGHGFSPDGGRSFPFRGRGIRIPRLVEAFEAFPGMRFNVEIKQNDRLLIDATLDAVAAAGREKLTLLAAAENDTMALLRARIRERGPSVAIGAATGDVLGFVRAALGQGEPPPEPMALQIPPEFAGRPLVTRTLVDYAHSRDVQVHVWTINEPAEMHRLLDLDVDALMSDFPARVQQVLAERRARA